MTYTLMRLGLSRSLTYSIRNVPSMSLCPICAIHQSLGSVKRCRSV